MEGKSTSNAFIIHNGPQNQFLNGRRKKKRFSLFKTAMAMLHGCPDEKLKSKKLINIPKKNDKDKSDENWKKVVGAMRALHSHDTLSAPPRISATTKPFSRVSTSSDDDFFGESPALSTTSWGTTSYYGSSNSLQELAISGNMKLSESSNSLSSKMSDTMSRYASALNLQDLDIDEKVDEDIEDDRTDDQVLEIFCEADDMIDSKADEFIARFYDQMKSQ